MTELFREYYNRQNELTSVPSGGKILIQSGAGDPDKIDASLLGGGSEPSEYNGTVIPLDNPSVTYCNMNNSSSADSYTLSGVVLGGKARLLINTATIPDIVGAVRIKGDDFQANTDIYLEVENNGVRTEYWVKQISVSPAQDLTGLPFGATIVITPDANNTFIGDPCILEATSGRAFISHSYFGASGSNDKESYIYYNDDINSDNWTLIKTFTNFIWGTLFEYNSDLYTLGVTDYPLNGVIQISKSTDNGITWSNPSTVLNIPSGYGGWHTSAINPIFKDGYLVKAFEIRDTTIDRHKFNNAVLVFADLTDLTNASNWSYSNIVPFNDAAMEAAGIYNINTPNESHGFLEGNIVEKANGDLINLLRLEQAPNSNNAVYLDVNWDAVTPPNSTLSTTHNFIDMYGGNVKFQILYDTVSAKHWTIANYNRFKAESDNRIEAYLLSSDDDCVTWKSHGKVLGFDATIDWENEIEQLGVQYSHFIIKGDDLYVADRTANEFADDYHNANLLTLTKIEDFRTIPEDSYEDGSMILDENSNRIEDVNGISVIEDQSSKINSPYMLISDNAEKPTWSNGIDFNGAEQLRVVHNRHVNIDNGFTVFFVVENLQTISGCRFLSKSNGEGGASGDVGVKDYFLAPNTGLGVQNTRGVYGDLTVGNDYIFASSYDNVNEDIYNYLNGANRGTPTSVNDGTFNTDRIELGTPYTVGNFGELIIGNRDVLTNLYMDGLVKAIHIYPEYMTPTEVIAKMTSLNSIYSIY